MNDLTQVTGNLTKDDLAKCLPKNMRGRITDAAINEVNILINDPDMADEYREGIIGYLDVLKEGRYKFTDYINVVKFAAFKLRGDTNEAAYSKVFIGKIQQLHARGITDISPWVASFSKSKLLEAVLTKSLIPTHVLNADIYQKAINVLATIMVTSKSDKARVDAANSLINNLKAPETSKIELDINLKQDSGIEELRATTAALVKAQREAIATGENTAKGIAHSSLIIQGEVENATP